jgi:phage recombination protein Bet
MAEPSKEKGLTVKEVKPKKSAIDKLAARLDLSPALLTETLKASAFSLCKTNEQFVSAVIIANTYGLNPLLREMYAFPGKSGGVIPILGFDGWVKIANRQDNYNGVELIENENEQGELVSVTAKFYLKNTDHPVVITEYLKECFDATKEPWKRWPRRMLRHKAYIQGARIAFGFSGIYDEDEKDRIIEAEAVEVTDPLISLKGDKTKKDTEKKPGEDAGQVKDAEIVDDPLDYVKIGDLKRFGESAEKAKFLAENVAKCEPKLGKEKFMAILGAQGVTNLTEISKFEDLVKLTNVLLDEVKKLEQ